MPLPLFRLPPHLQRAWIAERLARPAPPAAVGLSDGFRLPGREGHATPAAVLVPVVNRPAGLTVLLTERSHDLPDHPGQISFPGGRVEESDPDAVATALRESEEEIGLPSQAVDVLGRLPEYRTVTGYRVTPVVALIERPFTLRLDTFEVSEAFEVPLAYLMDPANHERRLYRYADIARTFYAMPYQATRRYFIWGATAAMLRNFYHFLRA